MIWVYGVTWAYAYSFLNRSCFKNSINGEGSQLDTIRIFLSGVEELLDNF